MPTLWADWFRRFSAIPVFASLLGCVVWLWRRQRHVEGEERRRYTLILHSFSLLVCGLVFGISMFSFIGDNAWLGAVVAWPALPYAVIRHGLYGVDRLVQRTVGYGLIAFVIALVYVLPVVLLPRLLGESNDLVIAASTLAAAAAFNPVRRRIRRAVDRRFDRTRFDAQQVIDMFAERLTDEVALRTVVDDLQGVLQRTVAPSEAPVWLRASRTEAETM